MFNLRHRQCLALIKDNSVKVQVIFIRPAIKLPAQKNMCDNSVSYQHYYVCQGLFPDVIVVLTSVLYSFLNFLQLIDEYSFGSYNLTLAVTLQLFDYWMSFKQI